jgi:hypothetical protein
MKKKTNKVETVRKEVVRAYADCNCDHKSYAAGLKIRNLHFRASAWVTPAEAAAIMTEALGGGKDAGYNAFSPSLLLNIPERSKVWIARESSVCMYVEADEVITQWVQKMKADEADRLEKTGEWRLWWD